MKISILICMISIFTANSSRGDQMIFNDKSITNYSIGFYTSPGITTNASMPSILGFQVAKKSENFDYYFEIAKGTYKSDPYFSTATVIGEKREQKSKSIIAFGIKHVLWSYFVTDLGFGLNQFSYADSGTDSTCCVLKDYRRSYDFSGAFIRPSIGAELNYLNLTFGIRLLAWMEYISKSTSNFVDDKPINPYITSTLDANDKDNVQSSHLLPPHIYLNLNF